MGGDWAVDRASGQAGWQPAAQAEDGGKRKKKRDGISGRTIARGAGRTKRYEANRAGGTVRNGGRNDWAERQMTTEKKLTLSLFLVVEIEI